MLELAAVISAILANGIVQLVKPQADYRLTETEASNRRLFIQFLNGLTGLGLLVVSSYVLNEPLDLTSVQGTIETLAAIGLTYFTSQGVYAKLMK